MNIKFNDGAVIDTDKLRDVLAIHAESLEKSRQELNNNNLYYLIFTLDNEGNGSAAFNIPSDSIRKIQLFKNADCKLREITNNIFGLQLLKTEFL